MKEQKKDFSDVEYRFSFSLTINDNEAKDDIIICKRDFNIYNLDEESLYSIELKETIDDIVYLINRDLKSKSRVYTWYNMPLDLKELNYDGSKHMGVYHGERLEANDISPEFSTLIPEESQTNFKFTLFDKGRAIITKIWSGDGYPFSVRNSVDLTNKKYKYENVKNTEMDFTKQIAQKASSDKMDLTGMIMRHISSTCASYQSKQDKNKLMYKQSIPELALESMVINDMGFSNASDRLQHIRTVTGDNGFDKLVYEVYTTTYKVGGVEYDLSNTQTSTVKGK